MNKNETYIKYLMERFKLCMYGEIQTLYGKKIQKDNSSTQSSVILGDYSWDPISSFRSIDVSDARCSFLEFPRWGDAIVTEDNLCRRQRVRATTSQEECYSPRGSRDRFAGADLCSKYLQDEPPRRFRP